MCDGWYRLVGVVVVGAAQAAKIVGAIQVGLGDGPADSVRPIQPTGQVDKLAAFRAKGPVHVGRLGCGRQPLMTNGA